MTRSIYLIQEFAEFWEERAGNHGEPYKRYVLDPIMFNLMGDLTGKSVVEIGCGNGYLAPIFLKKDVSRLVMMDISNHNLDFAAQKSSDYRVQFVQQDATKTWVLDAEEVDIVFSNMMLNELSDISTPIKEAYRVLKYGGIFVFSVTHPSWDLFVYAQEKNGTKSEKILDLGGYFRRGYSRFIMSRKDRSHEHAASEDNTSYEVEHYQRPLSDYVTVVISNGFKLTSLIEPELTNELLEFRPSFGSYSEHPVGLIIAAVK